jgi:glycosyltransferase involved in cell wall biosynthesis
MSIAVIIPTYNRQDFVARAIASVQQQECHLPVHIIVVDDGSTDNTQQVLDNIIQNDDRVIVIYQENQGVSAARNAGIHALPDDVQYVTFLDSDDIMIKGRFCNQVLLLEQEPEIGYLIGAIIVVNDIKENQLEPTENSQYAKVITHSASGAIYRRDIFAKIGEFDCNLRASEDLDLFLRLAEARVPFKEINDPCIYYVQHQQHHITEDKLFVAKCTAKAIALSIVRRRKSPGELLMPKFDNEALKHWMNGEKK